MKTLNELRDEIHRNALEHGWWDEERTFGDIIALCHTELSEAMEAYRSGLGEFYLETDTRGNQKPEGIAVELADCIIRILDYCGRRNIDIYRVVWEKHLYNLTREYRHGGKRL